MTKLKQDTDKELNDELKGKKSYIVSDYMGYVVYKHLSNTSNSITAVQKS